MSPEEKSVIAGIFDRLKQVEGEARDPQAEREIADRVRQQPYAPYAMAQAIHVQEQALMQLHQQNEALRAEVEELSRRPQGGGGFLSGIFGGGSSAPQPAPSIRPGMAAGQRPMAMPGLPGSQPGQAAQAAGPWGAQPQRGGFLAGAMTTAVGVAGGMLLGNALMSAFGGGNDTAAAGSAAATDSAAAPAEPAAAEGDAAMDDGGFDAGGDW